MEETIIFKEEYPFIEWNDQFLCEYALFCEAEEATDDTFVDDVEEAVPGLYGQWLKNNGYDPKTHTINVKNKLSMDEMMDSDLFLSDEENEANFKKKHPTYDPETGTISRRVTVPYPKNSKKLNRLNKFLKLHDFDPKDGTIVTDEKHVDGSPVRVPLNIGLTMGEGGRMSGTASGAIGPVYARTNQIGSLDAQLADVYNDKLKAEKYLKEELKESEPDQDMIDLYKDTIESSDKKFKDLLKYKKDPKGFAKHQQKLINDRSAIQTPIEFLTDKPKYTNHWFDHEKGHSKAANNTQTAMTSNGQLVNMKTLHGINDKKDAEFMNRPYRNPDGSLSVAKGGNLVRNKDKMSAHDLDLEERYADLEGVKQNPYVKSRKDAYDVNSTGNRKAMEHLGKRYTQNQLRKLKNQRKEGSMTEEEYQKRRADIKQYTKNMKKDLMPGGPEYIKSELRAQALDNQLPDDMFGKSNGDGRRAKTSNQRAQEKKERGDLSRKKKKELQKQQNVVKEYMI